jgi:hypothetical protein
MMPVTRRLLIVAGLVLFAFAGVLLFETILTPVTILSFGRTPQGQVTGWIGLAIILMVFGYPLRKRAHQNRLWPHRWLQIHMVAGVLGPLVIILHAGVLHMHALVPILAMVAMGIVALSGIIGQHVHYLAFRTLYKKRHELLEQGVSSEEVETRLLDMTAREKMFRVWQMIHAPMTLMFMALVALHVIGALYFGGLYSP